MINIISLLESLAVGAKSNLLARSSYKGAIFFNVKKGNCHLQAPSTKNWIKENFFTSELIYN